MIIIAPAPSTEYNEHDSAPSPSSTVPHSSSSSSSPPSKLSVDFSPPLIAMVVIIATAFVFITYSRLISRHFLHLHRRWLRWRRRRRLLRSYVPSTTGDIESPPYNFDPTDGFLVLSPYGLDQSVIKAIPVSVYTRKSNVHECAVCLLEFEENDYVPRIRPSLDDVIIESTILEPLTEAPPESETTVGEITQEESPRRNQSDDQYNGRDFFLKRSYSFGFERNLGSERLVLEPVTASPWRYRRGGNFWSKRSSPFSSLMKPRVFSFRHYRGMKSPFFRRRGGFLPVSESSVRFAGGGVSSRRSKSLASPMFIRSSAGGLFSSSRLRSGDPEALLSPERFNRR
ncbi:hypothetical protein F0562_028620 [Nyssa sinensis]|uniref:RING-type E3 ubiquitin transferase n=1 Tax=Nyssa sinensis TaxID=561372 RepID=A0A5J5B2T5_9ASTE|nr:hypothetical protein F0562_028620 [Nyssa sinensis]